MTCENSQHKGWGMMHGQQEELRIIQFWSMSLTSWPFWEPDVENRTKRQILLTVKHKSLVQSVWVIKISDLYSMHFILLCLFRNFYWISKLLLDYLLNVFFKTCSLFFWAHLFYLKTKKSLQSIKHLYLLLLPSPYPMAYTLLANSLQRLQAVALSSTKSADEANEEICEPILQMKHFN